MEEQNRDTSVLNGMLDYYCIANRLAITNQQWIREMELYGTSILHIGWEEGRPKIENIPIRNFFIDPTATSLHNARYAGYVYLADGDALKGEKIYDAEKGEWVPRYQNLEKVGFDKDNKSGTANAGETVLDKVLKDGLNSSTLGDKATEKQVAVIRFYDLPTGRIYEIGNRKEFIFNDETWCKRDEHTETVTVEVDDERGLPAQVKVERKLDEIKPFLPFAALRGYVDPSLFYAEGDMALIMGDNELLNDYESMDVDNNAYQNTPMYWVDPQFADLAPEIETIPGAVYPIPRNAMGALERPQLSQDLDAKKAEILNRMRRATAADDAIQGVGQAKSRTTATEVQSQLQQGATRFTTKKNNMESEGYADLGSVIFKFIQIFVTKKTAQRIVGKNGVYFKDYDPYEFNGEYEAYVELDSTIQAQKQEVGMKMNQVFQLFTGDQNFNQVEVKRWMAQFIDPDLSDDKFNAMLAPPQKQPEPQENIVSISYKDLEPWGRVQAQKDLGWNPDPSLAGDMQNRLLEQANVGADHMDTATRADGTMVPGMEHLQNSPTPAPQPDGMPKKTATKKPAAAKK